MNLNYLVNKYNSLFLKEKFNGNHVCFAKAFHSSIWAIVTIKQTKLTLYFIGDKASPRLRYCNAIQNLIQ